MKNYTDTERLDWAFEREAFVTCSGGEHMVLCWTEDGDETIELCSQWHPTPRAAIDEAMNREADRRANEALENMTGGSAG